MAGRVRFGITGFQFTHLEGLLYPRGTDPARFFHLYADEFRTVELSEWNLQELGRAGLERLAADSPPDFRFSVTQHLELPHDWPRVVAALREKVEPLAAAGRLGAVVACLPAWFNYAKASREQLAALCQVMRDLPLAVDFARPDWYRRSVLEGLRERGVAMACTHSGVPGAVAVPAKPHVTARIAYVRFMGRRIRVHLGKANTYYDDCRYSPEDLAPWAESIMRLAAKADVYAVFQHHPDGSDVYSARLLAQLLGLA